MKPIHFTEIENKLQEWADYIVLIGQVYQRDGDYKFHAARMIDECYDLESGSLVFKPSDAYNSAQRHSKAEILSYLVGGCVPEDSGFALQPWNNCFHRIEHSITEGNVAISSGRFVLTSTMFNKPFILDFTFGFRRSAEGKVMICSHHSCTPARALMEFNLSKSEIQQVA